MHTSAGDTRERRAASADARSVTALPAIATSLNQKGPAHTRWRDRSTARAALLSHQDCKRGSPPNPVSNGVVIVLATARHRVRRTASKDPFYRLDPGGRFSPPLWLRLHPAEPPVSRHGHVGRT